MSSAHIMLLVTAVALLAVPLWVVLTIVRSGKKQRNAEALAQQQRAEQQEREELELARKEEEKVRIEEAQRQRQESEQLRRAEEAKERAEAEVHERHQVERESPLAEGKHPIEEIEEGQLQDDVGDSKAKAEDGPEPVDRKERNKPSGSAESRDRSEEQNGIVTATDRDNVELTDQEGLPDTQQRFAHARAGLGSDENSTYPVVELPLFGSVVKGTRIGKGGARGVSENDFFIALKAAFPDRVLRDHRLEFTGASRDYEPDIILHFEEYGLRIDIEIDEPYSGRTRKPMHWLGCYDDDRDLYFSNNGWMVVRFAERQVVCHPNACIAFLAKLVDTLLHTDIAAGYGGVEELQPLLRWSREDAVQMALNNERESYLHLEFEQVEEQDDPIIEFEEGLVRDPLDQEDQGAILSERNTGLAELPEAIQQLRSLLLEAIATGVHGAIVAHNKVFLLQMQGIIQRRARFFLQGFDVLSQRDTKLELRRIQQYEALPDLVLRSGDHSNPQQLAQDLQYATDEQLCVYVEYTSSSSGFAKRTLSCLQPTLGDGMFHAWCHVRNESRIFRFDRVHMYRVLDVKRPWKIETNEDGIRSIEPTSW